jgi:hypothetical protein
MMAWLSNLDRDTIQLAAQVTSTLVALLALFIGLRNEARNQRRFELQLSLSQKVARAAAKPLLAIEREGYEDVKAITIANHGPGTAICHVIKFVRGKKEASDISELIEINKDDDIEWNESTAYATPFYLAGKSNEDAFRITADRLGECGIAERRIPALLEDIEKQLDEIEIFVEYEDVFGSKFKLEDVNQ